MKQNMRSPRIVRREAPPKMIGRDGYRKAREHLRRDFAYRCGYCMLHERHGGDAGAFCIDHFQPRSKGGRVNDYANLYWACIPCNRYKGDLWPTPSERRVGRRFADPCQEQDYGIHFFENGQGMLIPQTPCGEYHAQLLRLNRPLLVKRRLERDEFITRRAEAVTLVEQLKRQISALPDDQAALQREILAHVLREIEAADKELASTIPLIPSQAL